MDLDTNELSPQYELFLRLETCLIGTEKHTPGHEQLCAPPHTLRLAQQRPARAHKRPPSHDT